MYNYVARYIFENEQLIPHMMLCIFYYTYNTVSEYIMYKCAYIDKISIIDHLLSDEAKFKNVDNIFIEFSS